MLSADRGNLPADLGALVAAGVRTGDLGRVLAEYVRLRRTLDDVHRKVWLAIAYPGFLVLGATALCFFFFVFVIPAMAATVKTITWNSRDPSSPPPRSVLATGVEASQWISRNAAGARGGRRRGGCRDSARGPDRGPMSPTERNEASAIVRLRSGNTAV